VSSRLALVHDWTAHVMRVLPDERVTRCRVLALFALGMIWAGTVRLNQVAATLPLAVRDPSSERRLGRFLANPAVSVERVWHPLVPQLLAGWAGQEVPLVFDPTPLGQTWTVLWVGIVRHRRVLPLAWRLVPQQDPWPDPLGPLLRPLLAMIAAAVPAGCPVTMLGDRGVSGPTLWDACRELGWEVVLRLNVGDRQANRLRLVADASEPEAASAWDPEQRLWDWAGQARSGWHGPAQIFKPASWRTGFLTGYQRRDAPERWVLFSTRPGGYARMREYARRGRVDATFADGKRRGWGLEQSHVRQEAPLDRLLVVWHLAIWWLHALGLTVIRRGLRPRFDRHDRRDRRVLRLGRLWLLDEALHDRHPPLPFRSTPTGLASRGTA
jgi:hypothetical protein